MNLLDKGKEILILRKELFELNIKDKSSKIGAKISIILLSGLMISLSLVFLGIALAIVINLLLRSAVWGFVFMGLIFAGGGILFFKRGHKIKSFVSFQILQMLDDEE